MLAEAAPSVTPHIFDDLVLQNGSAAAGRAHPRCPSPTRWHPGAGGRLRSAWQRAVRCCSPNPFSSHTLIALPYYCIACGSCCSSSALNRASCGCLPLRQLQRGSYTAVSAASALLRLSVRPRRLGCVSFYTSVHPSATKSIHYVLTVRMHNRFLFHVRDRDDVKLERRCNHHDQCNHRNETAHASVRSGLATWLLLGLRCGGWLYLHAARR